MDEIAADRYDVVSNETDATLMEEVAPPDKIMTKNEYSWIRDLGEIFASALAVLVVTAIIVLSFFLLPDYVLWIVNSLLDLCAGVGNFLRP